MSERSAERPTPTEAPATGDVSDDNAEHHDKGLVIEDLLVEEVSIDGMCGVY